jgi:hypothetical protein
MSKPDFWYSEEQLEAMKKFDKRTAYRFLYMSQKQHDLSMRRYSRNRDNRKWAWIMVGKTKKMAWVDNKTLKAYKADGYEKTWMEIKKYTFVRWCTSFDL